MVGFPRTFLLLDKWCRRHAVVGSLGTQRRTVRLAVEAVRIATRYYYRRGPDCLPRALVIFMLLRCRGVPATLRIGVKRFPFGAHAWVECLGEVLDESRDDWQHERYVPILSSREPV